MSSIAAELRAKLHKTLDYLYDSEIETIWASCVAPVLNRHEAMFLAYKAGTPIKELAKQYNKPPDRVKSILAKYEEADRQREIAEKSIKEALAAASARQSASKASAK